jgi:Leucine-rich repeat (LRR) protein
MDPAHVYVLEASGQHLSQPAPDDYTLFTHLHDLDLADNQLSSLDALATFPNIRNLNLSMNGVGDVRGIERRFKTLEVSVMLGRSQTKGA